MNTTQSIHKAPEKPAHEHHKKEPIRSGDTVVVSSAEAKPAAQPHVAKAAPAPAAEDVRARTLRILKTSLDRLKGRGMPEQDKEVSDLITELGG